MHLLFGATFSVLLSSISYISLSYTFTLPSGKVSCIFFLILQVPSYCNWMYFRSKIHATGILWDSSENFIILLLHNVTWFLFRGWLYVIHIYTCSDHKMILDHHITYYFLKLDCILCLDVNILMVNVLTGFQISFRAGSCSWDYKEPFEGSTRQRSYVSCQKPSIYSWGMGSVISS